MTRSFQITFDYLCPFARNANEHVITALRAGADLDVRFLPYSLSQGHVDAGEPAVWDQDEPHAVPGVLALQVGLLARDDHPERFLDVHEALFAARHDAGRHLGDADVLRAVLTDAGLSADAVFAGIDDGRALELLRREHTTAVEDHGVWGVPTFITDRRAVFVRLMDRPGDDGVLATARVEQVVDLVDAPAELNEFKQVDLPV